jgi:hypothetical protein
MVGWRAGIRMASVKERERRWGGITTRMEKHHHKHGEASPQGWRGITTMMGRHQQQDGEATEQQRESRG